MKPSPGSPALFCSSPQDHTSPDPSDEVNERVLEAQNVHTFNPAIAAMLQDLDKKKDFLHHMHRSIQLIKSRSQAFEDAHVTVYDKTLLTLTRNGNKLDHPPAIEYYCDEFLGVSNSVDQVLAMRMLEQSICVPNLLSQEDSPPSSDPRSSIESFEALTRSQRQQSTTTLATSEKSLNYTRKTPEMEPHVARLWSLYEKARADFQVVVPKKDSQATADSARFLRDTAENTIQYLKTKDFDPVMMVELHAVYDLAKATAVSATGGKRRKFDMVEMDRIREEPRQDSYSASSFPQRQERYSPYPSTQPRGPSRSDRYNAHPGVDGGRPERRGRGPSGIPYGYSASRAVDSYHPY